MSVDVGTCPKCGATVEVDGRGLSKHEHTRTVSAPADIYMGGDRVVGFVVVCRPGLMTTETSVALNEALVRQGMEPLF